MYGSLTGLSKKMTAEKYGNEQLKKWRRSYDTRPPPVSSFSTMYPGNDERYVKYVRDVPISYFETIVRTLAERRLQIHRAFPKVRVCRLHLPVVCSPNRSDDVCSCRCCAAPFMQTESLKGNARRVVSICLSLTIHTSSSFSHAAFFVFRLHGAHDTVLPAHDQTQQHR